MGEMIEELNISSEQFVTTACKKISVFKIAKQKHIETNTYSKECPFVSFRRGFMNQAPPIIIAANSKYQQYEKNTAGLVIKEKANQ